MAQIIKFRKKEDSEKAKRVKALVHGRIRTFTCDYCGEDFEVVDEKYPNRCPGCGLRISGWNKSEDDT